MVMYNFFFGGGGGGGGRSTVGTEHVIGYFVPGGILTPRKVTEIAQDVVHTMNSESNRGGKGTQFYCRFYILYSLLKLLYFIFTKQLFFFFKVKVPF